MGAEAYAAQTVRIRVIHDKAVARGHPQKSAAVAHHLVYIGIGKLLCPCRIAHTAAHSPGLGVIHAEAGGSPYIYRSVLRLAQRADKVGRQPGI